MKFTLVSIFFDLVLSANRYVANIVGNIDGRSGLQLEDMQVVIHTWTGTNFGSDKDAIKLRRPFQDVVPIMNLPVDQHLFHVLLLRVVPIGNGSFSELLEQY